MTISLQEGAYTVSEGEGSVSVCAEIAGVTEREVIVTILTGEGGGTGEFECGFLNDHASKLISFCSRIQ